MAASFASASSQSLSTTVPELPSTGYPFAVGMWVAPSTLSVEKTLFSFADTASANNYLEIRQTSGNNFAIAAAAGGAENTATAGINGGANRWNFVLARFDSATLRRIDAMSPTGQTPGNTVSTSTAPTSLDTLALGARIASTTSQYFDGLIGEFWYANVNIQPSGGAANLLRQLALGGPFSVPRVAQNVVQYWSFREHPTAAKGEEAHIGAGKAWQRWTNTGGVTTGRHPPIPYWYDRPRPARRPLVF